MNPTDSPPGIPAGPSQPEFPRRSGCLVALVKMLIALVILGAGSCLIAVSAWFVYDQILPPTPEDVLLDQAETHLSKIIAAHGKVYALWERLARAETVSCSETVLPRPNYWAARSRDQAAYPDIKTLGEAMNWALTQDYDAIRRWQDVCRSEDAEVPRELIIAVLENLDEAGALLDQAAAAAQQMQGAD
jgi:hypothetical protein